MGGDEFAVVLPGITPEALADRVPKLHDLMREVDWQVGAGGVLGLSVGMAQYPVDGVTTEELLGAADRQMYNMKHRHHAERPELSRSAVLSA